MAKFRVLSAPTEGSLDARVYVDSSGATAITFESAILGVTAGAWMSFKALQEFRDLLNAAIVTYEIEGDCV